MVEPGCHVIMTLFLRSGVELHLKRGAELQAHPDLSRYSRCAVAADNIDQSPFHLIVAEDCANIAITGAGVIDGQDQTFWQPCVRPEEFPYGIFHFTARNARLSPLVQLVRARSMQLSNFNLRTPSIPLSADGGLFIRCQP